MTRRGSPQDGAGFGTPPPPTDAHGCQRLGDDAPKMLRGDAITQKLRTTEVQLDGHPGGRYTIPDAQIRGTEDAFPMRRELVLDDSYEISPLAFMSLGVGMQ